MVISPVNVRDEDCLRSVGIVDPPVENQRTYKIVSVREAGKGTVRQLIVDRDRTGMAGVTRSEVQTGLGGHPPITGMKTDLAVVCQEAGRYFDNDGLRCRYSNVSH